MQQFRNEMRSEEIAMRIAANDKFYEAAWMTTYVTDKNKAELKRQCMAIELANSEEVRNTTNMNETPSTSVVALPSSSAVNLVIPQQLKQVFSSEQQAIMQSMMEMLQDFVQNSHLTIFTYNGC